jgi:acyl carrier protein
LTSDDLRERVLDFVRRELVRDEDLELTADEPLFSSGLLDSFSVTRLIVFLEDEFGVRVPIPEVTLPDSTASSAASRWSSA